MVGDGGGVRLVNEGGGDIDMGLRYSGDNDFCLTLPLYWLETTDGDP